MENKSEITNQHNK